MLFPGKGIILLGFKRMYKKNRKRNILIDDLINQFTNEECNVINDIYKKKLDDLLKKAPVVMHKLQKYGYVEKNKNGTWNLTIKTIQLFNKKPTSNILYQLYRRHYKLYISFIKSIKNEQKRKILVDLIFGIFDDRTLLYKICNINIDDDNDNEEIDIDKIENAIFEKWVENKNNTNSIIQLIKTIESNISNKKNNTVIIDITITAKTNDVKYILQINLNNKTISIPKYVGYDTIKELITKFDNYTIILL